MADRPCLCGGCPRCLHDQGYAPDSEERELDADDFTECDECGNPLDLEERLASAMDGEALCAVCCELDLNTLED